MQRQHATCANAIERHLDECGITKHSNLEMN